MQINVQQEDSLKINKNKILFFQLHFLKAFSKAEYGKS